jgi:hypothetical protein
MLFSFFFDKTLASQEIFKLSFYQSKTKSMKQFTNRLIKEKSPYLLQHAKNPVDWFPWGEEAFKLSKKENKPIFLSKINFPLKLRHQVLDTQLAIVNISLFKIQKGVM